MGRAPKAAAPGRPILSASARAPEEPPRSRIRVIQLLPSLEIGGMEVLAATLASRLDRRRFDPSVCCFDGLGPLADELEAQGVGVMLLRRRPGIDLGYPLRLRRRLRSEGTDVLHAHNATAFFYGTIAARLSGAAAAVFTEHDRVHPDRVRIRWTHRILSRFATRSVAVSEFLARALRRGEGFPANRLVTIPNGIDEEALAAGSDREGARRALGLAPDGPVIGVVAGLKPVKNHPVMLRAFRRVRDRIAGSRLLFVGDGPQRDELRELATELRISADVHFLGFRRDVGAVLAAVDVVALASSSEGLPLAVLEAMACARPVVATDVGAISEAVVPGETGRLVPPGDPEALADALVWVLEDPARARELGRRGRERFRARFTLERMVRAYEEVYETVLAEARRTETPKGGPT